MTCPLGCGAPAHPNARCDGTPIDWPARRARALAWGAATQAEHDKAAAARASGRHYTAKVIDYRVED